MTERCVALLGQRDMPTDAVEEYCRYLGAALGKHAFSFEIARVDWATKGWRRALRELRQKVADERNTWVLLQYTALAWSRHGFSLRVPGIIKTLKKNGARCAVVFHDAEGYYGNRLIDRIRRATQLHTMREALRLADLSILTIPAEKVPWIGRDSRNVVFIPVGANLPSPEKAWSQERDRERNLPTVAVFSPSGNRAGAEEVESIALRRGADGSVAAPCYRAKLGDCRESIERETDGDVSAGDHPRSAPGRGGRAEIRR